MAILRTSPVRYQSGWNWKKSEIFTTKKPAPGLYYLSVLACPHFTTSVLLFGRVGAFFFCRDCCPGVLLICRLLPGGSVYLSTGGSILLSAIGKITEE